MAALDLARVPVGWIVFLEDFTFRHGDGGVVLSLVEMRGDVKVRRVSDEVLVQGVKRRGSRQEVQLCVAIQRYR